ncbi:MAG: alpha-L-fucosidase [Abitibacteriaceae bacterium]|nr:alpha-L-fucosidase [Abditibacteriaceae bacterium]MBV9865663.1 alpha-L-fucosidase [Abditibacteriaceae bacterium]
MMQSWFPDAKLGIFLHWGIYSVKGIPESWAFFNRQISYEDYMAQCSGFTANHYDPQAWANLFQRAGAKYAVLTSKHHDGVALWDTQLSDLSVVKQTPAARDLLTPYCEALREKGLKVGIYFSHLDWSHPDYAPIPPEERHGDTMEKAYQQWSDGPNNPTWQRFLKFHRGQLEELCTRFGKVDLLWFDGDWTPGDEYWRMAELREQLLSWQPETILNSRMRGHGDYQTPEQGIPISRPEGPWEFCVTINDSWGYQPQDQNYKSVRQIVRMFAECIGMGGNLLLDITPKEDGIFPPEQVERLEALGDWIRQHEEAVYATEAGLPAGHLYGTSTLSKDHQTLYAMIFDRPWDEIAIKGIRNQIKRVSVVGSGHELSYRKMGGAAWMNIPGVLWIEVPEAELNPNATVIKIELDGPLDLYSGAGHAIESN